MQVVVVVNMRFGTFLGPEAASLTSQAQEVSIDPSGKLSSLDIRRLCRKSGLTWKPLQGKQTLPSA